jgi:threonyl-tRNA synthetase
MLVVGDREEEARAAALRRHREGDLGTHPLGEVVARLAAEAAERRPRLRTGPDAEVAV